MDDTQSIQLDLDFDDQQTINATHIDQHIWAIDGHGDAFSISSRQWDSMNSSIVDPGAYPYTISTGTNLNWPNNSPSWSFSDLSITSPPSGKITLTGDDADIEINGESVIGMLKDIRDRLNILQVSEQMEQEWDELRLLREQYEAKLAECREKSKIWNTLKS